LDTQKWAQDTLARLEDMKHHHVVFTLPKRLRTIARYNQNEMHNLIFECANFAILDWFKIKHDLKPGIVSVLHTFGSDLKYHPHVHMLVTAGGLDQNKELIQFKSYFLTRQRFLADKFKKRFIFRFRQEVQKENINLPPSLNIIPRFSRFINKLLKEQWITNIQKPLDDLMQIVGYVGRYTKRACISEYKIHSINNDHIHFLVNDYQNSIRGQRPKTKIIKMQFVQFLDQLLQHVPNKRYRMVRYAGIYNSHYLKKKKTEQKTVACSNNNSEQSNLDLDLNIDQFLDYRKLYKTKNDKDPLICPNCKIELIFDQIVFKSFKHFIDDS